MSLKIMSRVWEHSTQSGTRLLVLLALADVANDHGVSWYSKEKLAQRARTSPRNIAKILQRLEDDGEAARVERPGTSNYYVVLTGMDDAERAEVAADLGIKIDALTAVEGCPNVQGGGEQMDTPTHEQMDKGGMSKRSRGDVQTFKGGMSKRTPDPSVNPKEPPDETSGGDPDAPPPADLKRWQTAVSLVTRWRQKRGLAAPDPKDPGDRSDYYEPAINLARLFHDDEAAAFRAVLEKYRDMLAAGYTPNRLAPVVTQILADHDRAALPAPASAQPALVLDESGVY